MFEIMSYLSCLDPILSSSLIRQFSVVAGAMLSCRGQVNMLNLSRWSGKGGSYRSIQRFYASKIFWLEVNWILFSSYRLKEKVIYLLCGDETTVTKSGKCTHGLGRFFSSIQSRCVKGLGFFSLCLVDVSSGEASPLLMESLDPDMKRATKIQKEKKGTGKRGRPKGSKNKNSRDVELTDYLKCLQGHILKTLTMIGTRIQISYFVYDGAFGNNECLQMVKGCGLSLISKLQCKSALWFPYQGKQTGKGGPKKYGNKVDYSNLPDEYLVETTLKEGIEEKTYQIELLHKDFSNPLNVTIIQRRRVSDDKAAQVILYSNDLELSWDNMIHYYRLRFKIEFTFRDAKQYWGLEDFMNIKETQVKNAANLSMFMVNFSRIIASQIQDADAISMLDLKAQCQGLFYLEQVLKIDPQIQKVISFEKLQKKMANIGRIHISQNQPIIKDKMPLNHPAPNTGNKGKDTKFIETEKKGTAVIAFAEITKKSLRLVANYLKMVTRKSS